MTDENRSSGHPPRLGLVGFPPLLYVRRRRWAGVVLSGLIYVLALAFLGAALWIAIIERDFVGSVLWAGVGLVCWLLLYQNVRSEQSRTAVATVPVAVAAGFPSWVFWLVQLLVWAILAVCEIVSGAARRGCPLDGPLGWFGLPALSYIAVYTVLRFIQRLVHPTTGLRRTAWPFTRGVLWTAVVVTFASIILLQPLYAGIHSRVRQSQAQADVKALAIAVSQFAAHTGRLPDSLELLTKRSTGLDGRVAPAFIRTLPISPCYWSDYRYERGSGGAFSITTTGEGGTSAVRAP